MISQILHKRGERCALQTTSTYPVSEQNKVILAAGSSQASAEVCPPPLTNAINSFFQGRSEIPQGSTGKGVITLGPICSSQHHGRDEKDPSRAACALSFFLNDLQTLQGAWNWHYSDRYTRYCHLWPPAGLHEGASSQLCAEYFANTH